MGENNNNIFVIGSPDVDIILKKNLNISLVKKKYNINFQNYAICLFHPVTTEISKIEYQIDSLFKVLKKSKFNYVVILPNNDHGSEIILNKIRIFKKKKNKEF